ncbi:MAG: DUF2914 domain-containing protein [bacterium]
MPHRKTPLVMMAVFVILSWGGATAATSCPVFSHPADSVARAMFTTKVTEREPVDSIDTLYTDVNKIFYFSDIRDMTGKTVRHRWIYDGRTLFEKSFDVKGPRWRVSSSKRLMPEWTGEWKVYITDSTGSILREDSFVYLTNSGESRTKAKPFAKTNIPAGATEKSSVTTGHVERATLTSGIVNREPVDNLSSMTTDVNNMFFFTEIRDKTGQTILHRWIYRGTIKAEIPFKIGGPRWRVHSSKKIIPAWSGAWKVQVVDSGGNILHEDSFVFEAAKESN